MPNVVEGETPLRRPLPFVLYDTVDFIFSDFDCRRSACRGHARFDFAIAEYHFPSPTSAIGQLNNGVFHTLVFHRIISSA
jgi:hypothetical protein